MTEDLSLTPEILLAAYAAGVFPMSEGRSDPDIFWVDPKRRGILPLDGFHISRSLARRIRSEPFRVTYDRAFDMVVDGCADREETWINRTIRRLYSQLHTSGHAHSVELWDDATLVGGVYGVSLGGAFFGESMFSRRIDASKIALSYLIDRLRKAGYALFDTQFLTPHLASLGGIEVSRAEYRRRLADALTLSAKLSAADPVPSGQEVVQRNAQTS